jgi:N-methylhydantoinase A
VLGRIPGDTLAGGALRLDREAAQRALRELARRLGLRDAVTAAAGVVALAEAHIERALRVVSVERGHDPRDAALVAFGGAGGLHACNVAAAIGCRVVLSPRHAGLLSAVGALEGGTRRERSRTVLLEVGETRRLAQAWRALERDVARRFAARERRRVRLERWAEMRYRGQSHELSVRGGPGLAARFHAEHQRRYGFAEPGRAVEVVTIEARGAIPGDAVPSPAMPRTAGRPSHAARVREAGRWQNAPVWERETLGRGFRARGPAIIVESGATLWIPSRWSAGMHPSGTLVLERR